MLDIRPPIAAEAGLPDARGLCVAVTPLPQPAVSPYLNLTVLAAPLLLTMPFNIAAPDETAAGAPVAKVGWPPGGSHRDGYVQFVSRRHFPS